MISAAAAPIPISSSVAAAIPPVNPFALLNPRNPYNPFAPRAPATAEEALGRAPATAEEALARQRPKIKREAEAEPEAKAEATAEAEAGLYYGSYYGHPTLWSFRYPYSRHVEYL